MPRHARKVADDGIYHVLNRGNGRMDLFGKRGDFEAFVKLLEEGRRRVGLRIVGWGTFLITWHREGCSLRSIVMPRHARKVADDGVCHVLNPGNGSMAVFGYRG